MWYEIRAEAGEPAVLRIFGEIGFEATLDQFLADLDAVGERDLVVEINSRGGDVFDGLGIYNRLARHKGHVTTRVEVIAASMATVIAMAGDTKEMHDGSMWMIHKPSTFAAGNEDDFDTVKQALSAVKGSMIAAYAKGTGRSEDEINALLNVREETWMTAQEAKDFGFVDEIITTDLDIAACIATVDLTIFKNAPTIARLPDPADGEPLDDENPETEIPIAAIAAEPINGDKYMSPDELAEIEANARHEGVQAEISRRNKITALFVDFVTELGEQYDAVLNGCLSDVTVDENQANLRILQALKNKPVEAVQSFEVIDDAKDKFRAGSRKAILARAGVEEDDTRNEFRGMRMLDIAKESLNRNGVTTGGMRPLEIAGAAFSHSASDFPLLLEDSANKMLMDAYSAFPNTWSQWSRRGSVSDFKENKRLRMGTFANLETVRAGGEYTESSLSEERETIQASTKGRIISFDRQMLINDDLDSFSRVTAMMGRSAARSVEKDVYTTLTNNPTMSDSVALFHSSHNNLAGSGAAIAAGTVSAGKAAMRKQTFSSTDDEYLDILAEILLVPVALEDTARTLIASATDPGQANSRKPNIHQNTLEVVSSPYLDSVSATAWYLLGNASQDAPIIEVVFLDGVDTPFIDSQEGFNIDGVQFKVRLDYGVGAIDYRGAWKNAGA